MVDCSLCKHHYLKHTDKYSVISDCKKGYCKKGHFRIVNAYKVEPPKECLDFESVLPETQVAPMDGIKYDTGKNRMGLVLEGFSNALWEVGRVGTFGCTKYGENSWQNLDNAKLRYLDALCRHLFKHLQGEKVDDESGLLHLQHMCWNALALLEFELKDDNMTCALKQSLDKVQEDMKVGGILKALKESEGENEI